MSLLHTIAMVLRNPAALVDRAEDREAFAALVPQLLFIVALGAGVFGAVVGSYRGGIQLAYAAIKMPMLFTVPLIVGLPAIGGLCRAADLDVSWPRLAIAGLSGAARSAVLAAAIGPVLWLVHSMTWDYHLAVMTLAGAIGLVGLPGLAAIGSAVPEQGRMRVLVAGGAVVVLGLLTAQTGWLLRPFIARPTAEVAFIRPVEEDVFSSLGATALSATGNYSEWEARPSGAASWGRDSR